MVEEVQLREVELLSESRALHFSRALCHLYQWGWAFRHRDESTSRVGSAFSLLRLEPKGHRPPQVEHHCSQCLPQSVPH